MTENASSDPSRLLRLDGRVALITGGARGIGAATATLMARSGARVLLADIDSEEATAVAETIVGSGGQAEALELDAADPNAIAAAFAVLTGRGLTLDILVNNAGIGAREASEDLRMESWRKVLALNLDGVFACSQAAARMMLPRGRGAIVTLSSIMGLKASSLYPNASYHASKGAVVNLTRALAAEWGPRGIRVNAVAPTFARTALTERLLSDKDLEERIVSMTPLGRLVAPEEVAHAILFLASDAAAMITGHTLPIDGGWMAH